ncbi:MAG TPA: hypothetical protein VM124_01990 [Candidatus Limnocylindrales bacterium]|nr:hypothetical protein [Candidatus Limnocylindrales bacterium]
MRVIPEPLLAHAFGQTYNLPLPLWLFIYGGAAAVILSFVVVAFFVGSQHANDDYLQRLVGILPRIFVRIVAGLSVLFYAFVVLAGIAGAQSFHDNIIPTLFWVYFLIAFAYIVFLIGNIWQFINPLKILFEFIEPHLGKQFKPRFHYPQHLGYFPALGFYFAVIWLELLSKGWGIMPFNLSVVIIGYSLLTIIGAIMYGKDIWFRYGDFFSVFFGFFGHISPVKYDGYKVYVRPPFVGLLDETTPAVSWLLFILFILSTTSFDGLRETAAYRIVFNVIGNETVMLAASPLLFLAIYWLFMYIVKRIIKTERSITELAVRFGLTLVPIAIAYHIAHYFTVLLIQGQAIIRLASDPLGLGWNLFNTGAYVVKPGIIGAAAVWYIEIALIIIGHIAAVYLAHIVALKLFPSAKKALLSQYPILALMVIYTMASLWIIAQPIVA